MGLFAEWDWDGETLVARVDALGFYSLFYCQDGDALWLSPSPIQLVAEGAPAEPDDEALGVFLRIGLFLGESTPFEKIRVLPPGGVLRWRDGRTTVTREDVVVAEAPLGREAALEGFAQGMREAVRRCLASCDDDLILPLSGGRDSRHILFELERHGRLPRECITYHHGGAVDDAEAEAARRVAERVAAPHRLLSGRRSRHPDVLRTLLLTHLCSDEHAQMLPLREHAGASGCATLDGIAGDVLSRNGGFANPGAHALCRRGAFEEVARGEIAGHARVLNARPEDVWGEQVVRRRFPEEAAVAAIAAQLERFASAADPVTSFLFWNRTRREISLVPTAVLSSVPVVLCPYLDHDLVRFLLSLPFEITSDGRFHDAAIAAAFPQHADLPYYDELRDGRTPRTSAADRLRTALGGLAMIARVAPSRLLRDGPGMLGLGTPARARKAMGFQRYYRMCTEPMSPAFARRLLRLGGALDARRTAP